MSLCFCAKSMAFGKVVGSTRKERKSSFSLILFIRGSKMGFVTRKSCQVLHALSLAAAKLGHWAVAMWSSVPGVSEQPGIWQKPLLSPDQWRLSQHVRYLPDYILSWTFAFSTSNGERPADVQIGWVLERDMKFGLNSERDLREAASSLNFFCQKSRSFFLMRLFKSNFCWR